MCSFGRGADKPLQTIYNYYVGERLRSLDYNLIYSHVYLAYLETPRHRGTS